MREEISPPGPGEDLINQFDLKDVKALLINHDFKYLMISMFVVMGFFNAVMTWIEDMLGPRGVSADQAGLIGGIMIVVGKADVALECCLIMSKARKIAGFTVYIHKIADANLAVLTS